MFGWLLLLLTLQSTAMLVDECVFHQKRGLGRWERISHPMDTAVMGACLAWIVCFPLRPDTASIYVILSVLSSLLITKDEFVHQRECSAVEHWLHSVLFILHPVILGVSGFAWKDFPAHPSDRILLIIELCLIGLFFIYQTVYWNFSGKAPWNRSITTSTTS